MFAGNFAPRGYSLCDGQLLAIAQNNALFSLLGTIYGGDGRTTFALPDLRSRLAIHYGNGPGISSQTIGERGGAESATVSGAQMPQHTHTMVANSQDANQSIAQGNVLANSTVQNSYNASGVADVTMIPATSTSGGGQSHNNIMPFQSINYIIALVGVFPSRN